jgi:hypothetical protein
MGALTTRIMPGLPFFFMNEQTMRGHLGSKLAGAFQEFTRHDQGDHNIIDGLGDFDMGGPVGQEAHRQYSGGFIRGASVDLDVIEYEFRLEDGTVLTPQEEFEAWLAGKRIILAFTQARIMGVTGTATPAFDETRLEVLKPARALTASYKSYVPEGRMQLRYLLPTPQGWGDHASASSAALVASAPKLADPNDFYPVPRVQPDGWYNAGEIPDQHFPVTMYPSGQLDGYFSLKGQKHPASQREAPRSMVNYAATYDAGETATIESGEIRCCPIFFDFTSTPKYQWSGEHPDIYLPWDQAAQAYRVDGRVGALGRIYEDKHGFRVRGGALFGLTQGDFARLKASSVSGDWRDPPRGGSGQELLAIASTPRPAFRTGGDETLDHARARYAEAGAALVASDTDDNAAGLGLGAYTEEQTFQARLAAYEKRLDQHSALIGERAFADISERLAQVTGEAAPKYFQVPEQYQND